MTDTTVVELTGYNQVLMESLWYRQLQKQAFDAGLVAEDDKPYHVYEVISALAFNDGVSADKLDTSGIRIDGANLLFKYAMTITFKLKGQNAFDVELFNKLLAADGSMYRLLGFTRDFVFDTSDSANPNYDPEACDVIPEFIRIDELQSSPSGDYIKYIGAKVHLPPAFEDATHA